MTIELPPPTLNKYTTFAFFQQLKLTIYFNALLARPDLFWRDAEEMRPAGAQKKRESALRAQLGSGAAAMLADEIDHR
jgi:hypothetical protein